MAESILQLRDLAKSYGSRAAVRGISLQVRRGEIVGLLGPNGAGKSTTINMLTGFLKPTSGEILWEGRPILENKAQWRRSIGVVLEELSLFEYLGVREHFSLLGRLYGLSAEETAKRTNGLLEFFHLEESADTVAREASQGTRKKLAFGLSLIHSPRLLLLDEALNGIDAIVVKDVKELLRMMAHQGTTIILSSHVLDSAETLIDRCVIINSGVVALDQSMEEITASGLGLEDVFARTVSGPETRARELPWLR
jgi:ABC-2 type transport system ATP-binding protein